MRVLFSSLGAIGHIHPLVPLAVALQARGHDVRWATGPESCAWVEKAGIPAVPAGQTQAERLAEFWRRYPETRERPPQEWPDVMFPKMFGEISAPLALADLLPLVRGWRPTLVVHDAAELAAPIAAAAVGVPSVTHAFGAVLPEARVRAAGEEVAALWRSEGLEPRAYGGAHDHLYLDIYPPRLQAPGGDHVKSRQPLRPVPFDGATDERLPADIADDATRPLLYLTFGTVFNDNAAFRAALAGIGDLGVKVVVTVGPNGDPAAFGPQPDHVVLERYIPQTSLLPACDVVVSHGGSGTVLAALGMGFRSCVCPKRRTSSSTRRPSLAPEQGSPFLATRSTPPPSLMPFAAFSTTRRSGATPAWSPTTSPPCPRLTRWRACLKRSPEAPPSLRDAVMARNNVRITRPNHLPNGESVAPPPRTGDRGPFGRSVPTAIGHLA